METGDYVIYKNNGYCLDLESLILKECVFDEEDNIQYSGNTLEIKNLKDCRLATMNEMKVNCGKLVPNEVVNEIDSTGSDEEPVRRGRKPKQ